MNIIIAQFAHIKPNDRSFNKYLNSSFKKQKIDIVVLGEYVGNMFFKEYKAKESLKKHFSAQEKYFFTLAQKYKTTFVAPIIECRDEKVFKSIMIASPTNVVYYQSQALLGMQHWNERAFFANKEGFKEPFICKIGDFNVATLFGWEAHFDEFWVKLKKKKVDIVIVPTASAFHSNARWARLLQTRSFLNNCYVVRVNRVGDYMDNNTLWEFYGNSFVALPDGNLGDMLGDKEGILVSEIKQNIIDEAKENWGFR